MASNKPKIFVDVNVFVDVSEKRQGWNSSLEIISGVMEDRYEGYISALTVPILYFRRIRVKPEKEARNDVRVLTKGFKVIGMDGDILEEAMDDNAFGDYEDAIQYHSAKKKCDVIITRNKKDFPHKVVRVLNPEEFLQV